MPLFGGLDADQLAVIAAAARGKKADTKGRIFSQGDVPHAFYYVLSGHVRRAIASTEGEEKLIDIVGAGRHFGLAELFGSPHYVSYAEAVEPTQLLEIGRDGLIAAAETSRKLSFGIMVALAERQIAFEQEVAATFLHSGCRRLIDYLIGEAGPNLDNPDDRVIKLQVSKSLVAKRIGVTAETLSRSFRDLSNAGLISVRGRTITLLEKLTARHSVIAEEVAAAVEQHNRQQEDSWGEQSAPAKPPGPRAWL